LYNFCTYFDHNYLPKGMVLYESLRKYCPSFKLYILCLNTECYDVLRKANLLNVILIALEDLEKDDPELLAAKNNRTPVEYYFTLTPCLPLYILSHFKPLSMITYLDSDLYFFSDPKLIFNEIGSASVGIIGHNFSEKLKKSVLFGKYNVGWISFRNDKNGLLCLQWYRDKCIEWCYDKLESNRYADQKYLDYFAENFEGVIEIKNKGANLAPWNVDNYLILNNNGSIYVDGSPLIFFHVQGLKKLFGNYYDSTFHSYFANLSDVIRYDVYVKYLRDLSYQKKRFENKFKTAQINGIRCNSRKIVLDNYFPTLLDQLRLLKRIAKSWWCHSIVNK